MKKIIALLAALGMFSLQTVALPISQTAAPTPQTNNAEIGVQMQNTLNVLTQATTNFILNFQQGSWNETEAQIAELIMSQETADELTAINQAILEQYNEESEASEESAEDFWAAQVEKGKFLLEKLKASPNIVEITRLLLSNQTSYKMEELNMDYALIFTEVWLVGLYDNSVEE